MPGFEDGTRLVLAIGDQLRRVDGRGAVTLDDHAHGEILDVLEGPGGKLYVRDAAALHELRDDRLVELLRFEDAILPVHDVAVDAGGRPWVVSDAGVGPHTDGGWQLTPLAELELDASAEIAFDHEGTAWLAKAGRALYREQDQWKPTEISWLGGIDTFRNAVGSPVGRVHVSNHHLMTRLGKGDFDSVVVDPKLALDYSADLDIAPDGYACVATADCHIACANAVPPTIIWRFVADRYACEQVEQIAVDAKHRVWVVSTTHLSLLDVDDREKPAKEWSRSELPALDGAVRQLVVVDPEA